MMRGEYESDRQRDEREERSKGEVGGYLSWKGRGRAGRLIGMQY